MRGEIVLKRVVKRKRVIKIERVAIAVFVFSVLLSMLSSVFLAAYNNELTVSIQNLENEVLNYQSENELYEIAVQNLSSKDRVMDIAEMEGLALNQSNVITISVDE